MADFDINAALKAYLDDSQSILTPEADSALADCENDSDAFSPGLINSVLNPMADAIGENPEAVHQASILDSLQFLLKCVPTVSSKQHSHGIC
jgi:condensin complex subunit 1